MNAETGADKLLLTYRGTVYPWHLDHMEHLNIQHYMAKFDEAVWNLFHRIGRTPSYLRAARRPVPFPEAIAARARALVVDYPEA